MKRLLFVALPLALILMACPKDANDDKQKKEEGPAVRTSAVRRGLIERRVTGTTSVESDKDIEVISEAVGRVHSLPVDEGSEVTKGQILCLIANPKVQIAQERARLELDQVRAEAKSTTRLNERGFVARRSRDEVEFRLRRAELELRRAEDEARLLRVIAPFNGVVTRRFVDVGEVVAPQRRLFHLVDHQNLRAILPLPEAHMPGIRLGLSAQVKALASGAKVEGQIERIAPIVEARTGTQRVTVALPAGQGLVPGVLVSVSILVESRASALLAPRRAFDLDSPQPNLFRVVKRDEEGGVVSVVQRLNPSIGLEGESDIEILSGINEGEQVVIAGRAALRDGVVVRVIEPRAEDAGGAAEDAHF